MTGREPEIDHTMLLVLSISFRDNKRQQKGFQRKYSSISLYPLDLGYWFKYETCTPQEKWQTSTSLSFFFLSFFLLSPKFKTAAGFCRLGSYTGHNTRPSSYSPSCPSLTKQSPSVTSSSDRRRPLGLCQDWVMCECWTGIREKNNTLHTEGQRSEGLKLPLFLFVLEFLWERTCRDCARDEEKGKKRTERKGVVVSTQVKHREKKWLEQE